MTTYQKWVITLLVFIAVVAVIVLALSIYTAINVDWCLANDGDWGRNGFDQVGCWQR